MKLYPILWTRDVRKTEHYLQKNRKDPMLQFYYALANQVDDQVEEELNRLITKYKDRRKQALFQTIYALHKQDVEMAKIHVMNIQPSTYQTYYLAAIALEEGKFDEAVEYAKRIPTKWMKDTIQCELARKQGEMKRACQFAEQAIEQTRGLQRYTLVKQFERDGLLATT